MRMAIYELVAERIEDGNGKWFPQRFYDDLDSARAFAGRHTSGYLKGKYVIAIYKNDGSKVRRIGEIKRINRKLLYQKFTLRNGKLVDAGMYTVGRNGQLKERIY